MKFYYEINERKSVSYGVYSIVLLKGDNNLRHFIV